MEFIVNEQEDDPSNIATFKIHFSDNFGRLSVLHNTLSHVVVMEEKEGKWEFPIIPEIAALKEFYKEVFDLDVNLNDHTNYKTLPGLHKFDQEIIKATGEQIAEAEAAVEKVHPNRKREFTERLKNAVTAEEISHIHADAVASIQIGENAG